VSRECNRYKEKRNPIFGFLFHLQIKLSEIVQAQKGRGVSVGHAYVHVDLSGGVEDFTFLFLVG
jgi:hypothetical protein